MTRYYFIVRWPGLLPVQFGPFDNAADTGKVMQELRTTSASTNQPYVIATWQVES